MAAPEFLFKPLKELPDPLPVPVLLRERGGMGVFSAHIEVPGSKSLTNRALLLAALAEGGSTIRRALIAEDTEKMMAALRLLGATVTVGEGAVRVEGCGGRWRPAEGSAAGMFVDSGDSGTTARFLAAAAMLSPIPLIVDGSRQQRARPLGELGSALESLGAKVMYFSRPGYPPVKVTAPGELPRGARVELGTTASSQFVSGLLLAAPFLPGGLTVVLEGEITSASYVRMTLGLLDQLGARVRTSEDLRVMRVSPAEDASGLPLGFAYTVEPDASSAAYFWGAAAICPGSVCRVPGLDGSSLQGDAGLIDVLARMGAMAIRDEGGRAMLGVRGLPRLDPVMADMSDMPDAALTLAAVACFAKGRSVLRGLKTLRLKESDRIQALQSELSKVGVRVDVSVLGDKDAITVTPPEGGIDCSKGVGRVVFETYRDHRMAMALALIGLRRPNVWIKDPSCVAKTFPGFWSSWAGLY